MSGLARTKFMKFRPTGPHDVTSAIYIVLILMYRLISGKLTITPATTLANSKKRTTLETFILALLNLDKPRAIVDRD